MRLFMGRHLELSTRKPQQMNPVEPEDSNCLALEYIANDALCLCFGQ